MKPFTQVEVLRFWFEDHETISLAQAKAGLPAPDPSAHYRVVSKPGIPGPGHPERVTKVKEDDPTKADPRWECSKAGCMSGVRPDVTTTFDSRYTTGKCFTHGKVVLVRR
jgi:hypothetical protein